MGSEVHRSLFQLGNDFRNWQKLVIFLININLLKQLLTLSVFYVIITT